MVRARSLDLLQRAGVPVVEVGPSGYWPFIDRPKEFRRCWRKTSSDRAPAGSLPLPDVVQLMC